MAAPPKITIRDLSGKWIMVRFLPLIFFPGIFWVREGGWGGGKGCVLTFLVEEEMGKDTCLPHLPNQKKEKERRKKERVAFTHP